MEKKTAESVKISIFCPRDAPEGGKIVESGVDRGPGRDYNEANHKAETCEEDE